MIQLPLIIHAKLKIYTDKDVMCFRKCNKLKYKDFLKEADAFNYF